MPPRKNKLLACITILLSLFFPAKAFATFGEHRNCQEDAGSPSTDIRDNSVIIEHMSLGGILGSSNGLLKSISLCIKQNAQMTVQVWDDRGKWMYYLRSQYTLSGQSNGLQTVGIIVIYSFNLQRWKNTYTME